MEEEEDEEDSEVINPPYKARVPANQFGYNGHEPRWATTIERWSRQQRQRSPFSDQRGYCDLNHGGSAKKALPIMIQQITNLGDQNKETAN